MEEFQFLGRSIILLGIVLVVLGAVISFGPRLLGTWRLPGDIVVKKGNFTFYFPVVSCLVISAALSLLFLLINLFSRAR
ncbi:MAG: DUF2905 domain-containing protein [Bacillota bacterium]